MSTMTTSETVAEHQHRCAKCGQLFTATCGHIVWKQTGPRSFDSRPAKPHEYPAVVPTCPACTDPRGF